MDKSFEETLHTTGKPISHLAEVCTVSRFVIRDISATEYQSIPDYTWQTRTIHYFQKKHTHTRVSDPTYAKSKTYIGILGHRSIRVLRADFWYLFMDVHRHLFGVASQLFQAACADLSVYFGYSSSEVFLKAFFKSLRIVRASETSLRCLRCYNRFHVEDSGLFSNWFAAKIKYPKTQLHQF